MISSNFVYLAFALVMIGDLGYAREVIRGRVKPNRVTWGLWAIGSMLGFFGQISEGVGVQALLTFAVGLGPMIIFASSLLVKNAYWKLGRTDYTFGAIALVGLALWQITGEGAVAVTFTILAELSAAIPTLLKARKEPDTESAIPFVFCAIASFITILTIDNWVYEEFAIPIYLLVWCSVIALVITKNAKAEKSKTPQ